MLDVATVTDAHENERPAASPQVLPFAVIAITSNSRTSLSHLVRSGRVRDGGPQLSDDVSRWHQYGKPESPQQNLVAFSSNQPPPTGGDAAGFGALVLARFRCPG